MKANAKFLTTVIAGSLAILSVAAMAQAPGAGGPGYGMRGPGYGPMAGIAQPERAQARMETLRKELKLTPAQTAAFDPYADKVKTEAEVRAKFHEGMQTRMGDPQAMSEYRVTIAKHNAEALEELQKLRTGLYATLTAEQKQVFDGYAVGPRFGPGFGAGPGYGHGWGPGHGRGWGPGWRGGCGAV